VNPRSCRLNTVSTREQGLHARVSETQGGRTLTVDLDGADDVGECILSYGAVMGDLLDLQQAPVGSKADLPQCGQVLE
jgi:hypothetical protein